MRNLLLLVFLFLISCSLDKSNLTPCNCAEIGANGMKEFYSNPDISKEEEVALKKDLEIKLTPCEKKSKEDSEFKKDYEKCYKEKMRDN